MRAARLLHSSVLVASIVATSSASATDWPQFGFDYSHSGSNTTENNFAAPVNAPLYHVPLSFTTDSAPIFLSGVTTASGTKDLLFISMKDGTLAALNAGTGAVVWSKTPTAVSTNTTNGGPTGSPVLDPAHNHVFGYGQDGKIHKYDVGTGNETLDPNWPEISTAKPDAEKSASSLSLGVTPTATYLYSVTDGYDGDGNDYQGHITAINLATGTQNVFNTLCSNITSHLLNRNDSGQTDLCSTSLNGIWGRAGAMYDAASNQVIIVSGNGEFGAGTAGNYNWGDSILALAPDASSVAGNPVDSYTPSTALALQNNDADLGSSSVALLPTIPGSAYAHVAVHAGKDSCVRLINRDDMSGNAKSPRHTGGELQAIPFPKGLAAGPNYCSGITAYPTNVVTSQPAVWIDPDDGAVWVYIANGSGLHAYKAGLATVNAVANTPQLTKIWDAQKGTTPAAIGGTSPVVAANTLYFVRSGNVYGLDPRTGAVLWNDTSIGSIHWSSPIVVNGRLYVIDQSSADDHATSSVLWAYQFDGVFRNGFN